MLLGITDPLEHCQSRVLKLPHVAKVCTCIQQAWLFATWGERVYRAGAGGLGQAIETSSSALALSFCATIVTECALCAETLHASTTGCTCCCWRPLCQRDFGAPLQGEAQRVTSGSI